VNDGKGEAPTEGDPSATLAEQREEQRQQWNANPINHSLRWASTRLEPPNATTDGREPEANGRTGTANIEVTVAALLFALFVVLSFVLFLFFLCCVVYV